MSPFDNNTFGKFAQNSQMSFAPNTPGLSTGNITIDMLISMLMSGSNFAPRPHAGQSVMEAYMQRERGLEFQRLMRQSFGTQLVAQRLGGINVNSAWGSALSSFLGQPDGIMNNPILRAFNGGNPVKAQMALMSNLTGMTEYLNTGRIGGSYSASGQFIPSRDPLNASFNTVTATAEGATKALYLSKVFSDRDFAKVQKDKEKELLQFVNLDKDRRKIMDKIITKDGEGSEHVDFEKIARIKAATKSGAKKEKDMIIKATTEEWAKIMETSDAVEAAKANRGKLSIIRQNFEKTRGFEYQDLTKSYAMALDLGLFDQRSAINEAYAIMSKAGGVEVNEKNATASQQYKARVAASEAYHGAAAAPLRAVTDLTGASTAEEAMSQMNALLGNSKLDMVGDSKYIEDLFRRVKSTARNAGISIDSMMGIVQLGKQVAMQHPELQAMGGAAVMEQAMKSFVSAQAVMAARGSAAVQGAGGIVAYTQRQVAQDIADRSEPIAQKLYAHLALIENSSLSDEAKEVQRQKLSKYATDINADHTPSGWADYVSSGADALGISQSTMYRMLRESGLSERGMRIEAEREKNGYSNLGIGSSARIYRGSNIERSLSAYFDANLNELNATGAGKFKTGDEALQAYKAATLQTRIKRQDQGDVDAKFLAPFSALATDATGQVNREMETTNKEGFIRTTYESSPDVQADNIKLKTINDTGAKRDAMFSARMPHLQANFGMMLAQELLGGSLGSYYNSLSRVLTNSEALNRTKSISENITAMNGADDNFDAVWGAMHDIRGGVMGSKNHAIINNLKEQGLTRFEMNTVLSQREQLTDKNKASLDKILKSGMTLEQIFNSVKGRDEQSARDTFKRSGFGDKYKVEFEDLRAASDLLWHGGFMSDNAIGRHGKETFNLKLMKQLTTEQATNVISDIGANDISKDLFKNQKQKFEELFSVLEKSDPVKAKALREKMRRANFFDYEGATYDRKSLHPRALRDLAESGTNIDLDTVLRDYGLTSGDARWFDIDAKTGKIKNFNSDNFLRALEKGQVHPEVLKQLADNGLINFDNKGVPLGPNIANLAKNYGRPLAQPIIDTIQALAKNGVVNLTDVQAKANTDADFAKTLKVQGYGDVGSDGKFRVNSKLMRDYYTGEASNAIADTGDAIGLKELAESLQETAKAIETQAKSLRANPDSDQNDPSKPGNIGGVIEKSSTELGKKLDVIGEALSKLI